VTSHGSWKPGYKFNLNRQKETETKYYGREELWSRSLLNTTERIIQWNESLINVLFVPTDNVFGD
jgi:hypothetical protein